MAAKVWVKSGPEEWIESSQFVNIPHLAIGEIIYPEEESKEAYKVISVGWIADEGIFAYYLSGFDLETNREWFPDSPEKQLPLTWFKLISNHDYIEKLQTRFHLKLGEPLQIGLASIDDLVDLGTMIDCPRLQLDCEYREIIAND